MPFAGFPCGRRRFLGADLTEQYRATADKLIDAALADTEGYNRLAYLCYRIGNRLSGSPGLEKAIAWSVETDEGRGPEQCARDSRQGAALGARRGIGAHAGARSIGRCTCSASA